MTKISDLSTLATINTGTVWPVVDANTTKKVSFATVKSAIQTPATANTLGAVKIGAGITVDSEGKISVSGNISVASNTVLGGVKIANDSNLTINPAGFLDLNKEINLRGSKIDGKTTEGHLDITADGLITISPGLGTIELFAGNELFGSSLTITSNGIDVNGIMRGFFEGSINGFVDGYLIGNIYEPGYTGSQQAVLNATSKTVNLRQAQVGDIFIGSTGTSINFPNIIFYEGPEEEFVISAGNQKQVRIDNLKNTSLETNTITSTSGLSITAGVLNLNGSLVSVNTDMQVSGTLTSGLFVPDENEIVGEVGLTIKSLLTTLKIESGYGGIEINGKDNTQEITRGFIRILPPSNPSSRSSTYLSGNVIIDNLNEPGGSFTLPSYTTTARNALGSQFNGTLIYNTTTNKVQAYANGSWVDLH